MRTSSNNRICGRWSESTANATLDFCPPDNVPISWRLEAWSVTFALECRKVHRPRHSANLEVAQMLPILLLGLSRKFRGQELNGGHCGYEWINVMLCKVPPIVLVRTSKACMMHKLTLEVDHSDSLVHPMGSDHPSISWFWERAMVNEQQRFRDAKWTNSVDFPDPLAPTMAILESKPTSMLAPLSTTFSGVYPNVTSDICKSGGEIFSVSGSLSLNVGYPTNPAHKTSKLTWNFQSHLLLVVEDQVAISRD